MLFIMLERMPDIPSGFEQVQMDDGSQLAVPGFVPKLSASPGRHRRNAPSLGQDTDDVLREIGLSAAQIDALRQRGIVR